MTVSGRKLPLVLDPLECPLWVNFGLSRPTAATSAFGGKADVRGLGAQCLLIAKSGHKHLYEQGALKHPLKLLKPFLPGRE